MCCVYELWTVRIGVGLLEPAVSLAIVAACGLAGGSARCLIRCGRLGRVAVRPVLVEEVEHARLDALDGRCRRRRRRRLVQVAFQLTEVAHPSLLLLRVL